MTDVHTALYTDKPADLTEESTYTDRIAFAIWEKSNQICLLFMKRSIKTHLKNSLPADCTAKELMAAISQRHHVTSNAEIGTLLQNLFDIKCDGVSGVRDYIIKMMDYQSRLRVLKVDLPDSCIVHQALNTLPFSFNIIKTNYNSQDESWSINDLIFKAVAEEAKLNKDKGQNLALYASISGHKKGKKFTNHTDKAAHGTNKESSKSSNLGPKKTSFKKNNGACFFCKKNDHKKKDCVKYKAWLSKRDRSGIYKPEEAKSG